MSLTFLLSIRLVGGDFTSRRKEIEYPNRVSETDPNHHVPAVTTETNYASNENGVLIMDAKNENRPTSFFAQPGILAGMLKTNQIFWSVFDLNFFFFILFTAVVGGAVVGLLFAILVVMFIVYRMRKKDEGSYALDEPKRSPQANSYTKNHNNREFYA